MYYTRKKILKIKNTPLDAWTSLNKFLFERSKKMSNTDAINTVLYYYIDYYVDDETEPIINTSIIVLPGTQ
jgi:hypothetical protein